jgi:signal transduction histidine kinase
MSRLSLRGRVTLASGLVLALGLAVLTLGINVILERQLENDASAALKERAAAQLATVTRRGGSVVLRDAPNDEALDQQAWVFADGRVLQRPRAPADVQAAAQALSRVPAPREETVGGGVRLRAQPVYGTDGKRFATVVVGLSTRPYDDSEHTALVATILLDLLVLAGGILLARGAVGNALRPVADMTRRAADWSEHDLDRRFNLGPPRDELTALSATLDGLLARIAASVRHEQRFSAEMAHELRTPLSGVRGEAELALRAPGLPDETREGLEQILRGTDRMEAVIETLLTAARRDARAGLEACDPVGAAEAAADAVRSTAGSAGVSVTIVPPAAGGGRAGADVDVLAQALQPLLDNAVRHARSEVTVSVEPRDEQIAFAVTDDGPGIDGADPEQLFQPGVSSEGGAGLGLPLARRLARACGGDVVAVTGASGGRFELLVPAVL